jgi:hypothetical protein
MWALRSPHMYRILVALLVPDHAQPLQPVGPPPGLRILVPQAVGEHGPPAGTLLARWAVSSACGTSTFSSTHSSTVDRGLVRVEFACTGSG